MRKGVFLCAVVVLLFADLGVAAAQTGSPAARPDETVGAVAPAMKLELTPAQRTAIRAAILQENRKVNVPAELSPAVGTLVPPSMELYVLPDKALMDAPAAKSFKYTMVNKKVVLVDPTNMRVVDVIGE